MNDAQTPPVTPQAPISPAATTPEGQSAVSAGQAAVPDSMQHSDGTSEGDEIKERPPLRVPPGATPEGLSAKETADRLAAGAPIESRPVVPVDPTSGVQGGAGAAAGAAVASAQTAPPPPPAPDTLPPEVTPTPPVFENPSTPPIAEAPSETPPPAPAPPSGEQPVVQTAPAPPPPAAPANPTPTHPMGVDPSLFQKQQRARNLATLAQRAIQNRWPTMEVAPGQVMELCNDYLALSSQPKPEAPRGGEEGPQEVAG